MTTGKPVDIASLPLAERIRRQALDQLAAQPASNDQLNLVLRLLAKHRSVLIQNTLLRDREAKVLAGPFAGMDFIGASAEGCHVPKLLGCYERELYGIVEAAIATNYDVIVNIGCAEGYYAVGLARRCPKVRILAYDSNPKAQQACRELATRNAVGERVTVGGTFGPAMFRQLSGQRALFLIDIEGHELELLQHAPAADLNSFEFIIECHDCLGRPISSELKNRLATSHDLRLIKHDLSAVKLPALFDGLGHLDQLLGIWEWRSGPTPWLVAAARPDKGMKATPFWNAVNVQV